MFRKLKVGSGVSLFEKYPGYIERLTFAIPTYMMINEMQGLASFADWNLFLLFAVIDENPSSDTF